jgi:hypothetical protein
MGGDTTTRWARLRHTAGIAGIGVPRTSLGLAKTGDPVTRWRRLCCDTKRPRVGGNLAAELAPLACFITACNPRLSACHDTRAHVHLGRAHRATAVRSIAPLHQHHSHTLNKDTDTDTAPQRTQNWATHEHALVACIAAHKVVVHCQQSCDWHARLMNSTQHTSLSKQSKQPASDIA